MYVQDIERNSHVVLLFSDSSRTLLDGDLTTCRDVMVTPDESSIYQEVSDVYLSRVIVENAEITVEMKVQGLTTCQNAPLFYFERHDCDVLRLCTLTTDLSMTNSCVRKCQCEGNLLCAIKIPKYSYSAYKLCELNVL